MTTGLKEVVPHRTTSTFFFAGKNSPWRGLGRAPMPGRFAETLDSCRLRRQPRHFFLLGRIHLGVGSAGLRCRAAGLLYQAGGAAGMWRARYYRSRWARPSKKVGQASTRGPLGKPVLIGRASTKGPLGEPLNHFHSGLHACFKAAPAWRSRSVPARHQVPARHLAISVFTRLSDKFVKLVLQTTLPVLPAIMRQPGFLWFVVKDSCIETLQPAQFFVKKRSSEKSEVLVTVSVLDAKSCGAGDRAQARHVAAHHAARRHSAARGREGAVQALAGR